MVKESYLDAGPCLFSGAANPSDVCQVWSFLQYDMHFFFLQILMHSNRIIFLFRYVASKLSFS